MKIIAESAFNHNGNPEYLKKLAICSLESNADYFTVQVYDTDAFCVKDYSKYKICEDVCLSERQWTDFFDFARRNKIELIPCTLDKPSFFMCYNYGFRFFKIHATDILNVDVLTAMSEKTDCKFLLETQCSTYQDIKFAVDMLGLRIEAIMHGYSNYPTELEDLRLNAIDYLRDNFPEYKYGIADHSLDTAEIPLMALAKGYDYLEKHITLTRNKRNYDWQVSLYPNEFRIMTEKIKLYSKSLGPKIKHPVKNELQYRNIIFKKFLGENTFKRSDTGKDYLTRSFEEFPKTDVGIALIARLKSQRLPLKVLKPFGDKTLIEFLYSNLEKSMKIKKVVLSTSGLLEDKPLANLFENKNLFLGHPISVLDRMLSLALREKWGGIFRVTGDNPFTSPELIDTMIDIFVEHDLDYVRANNVPLGISAELFSTDYLWNLYLNMENPNHSEYLSWFVLNDMNAQKGAVNIVSTNTKMKHVNLSVDYHEDYSRCLELLERIVDSGSEVCLDTVLSNLNCTDMVDDKKNIKLPDGKSILFGDYMELIENLEYKSVKIYVHASSQNI
jgi:N,N'-diacetyllegionaminate synthase